MLYHSFKHRFKSLIDQYELRELHFHSLMRTKELEVQLNLARYEKARKEAEAEAGRARSLNAQVLTFSKTETELRSQLNIYVEKFKQVGLPYMEIEIPKNLVIETSRSMVKLLMAEHTDENDEIEIPHNLAELVLAELRSRLWRRWKAM